MSKRLILTAFMILALAGCTQPEATAPDKAPAPPATDASSSGGGLYDAEAGEMCGGIAGIGCADGLFCQFEDGTCLDIADNAGLCAPIPVICTQEYAPVCGCDGETYATACVANGSGISVAAMGECPGE